jgi:hypothetical protein
MILEGVKIKKGHSFWDQVGMTISSLCFVHCMVTPIFLLTLPWLGEYFHDPLFHLVVFFLVVPVGMYAFTQGYGHHKNKWVLIFGVPGLLAVGLGAWVPNEIQDVIGHETVTVIGSVLLITAHYINRRTCKIHKH